MENRQASAFIDTASSGSIQKLSLSLDSSACFSTSHVLSEIPEDKRKILEHRLVNNPHAKNLESVVGFGENSRDKSYVSASFTNSECSRDRMQLRNMLPNECSEDKQIALSNAESSRDKSYVPGSLVVHESSKDKQYIPGAPITPLRPCLTPEPATRPYKEAKTNEERFVLQGLKEPVTTTGNATHLLCAEALDSSAFVRTNNTVADSGHFSAEELDSSDEESQGSVSSTQGQTSVSGVQPAGDDNFHSIHRKRKLFCGEETGVGMSAISTSKLEVRTVLNERITRKPSKNQQKKCRLASENLCTDPVRVEKSPPKASRTITHFFAPTAADLTHSLSEGISLNSVQQTTGIMEKERELVRKEADLETRERSLALREREIADRESSHSKFEEEALQRALSAAREDRIQAEGLRRQHDQKVVEVMKSLLVARAQEERSSVNARLCSDTARVGRVAYIRSGMSVSEVWEDGSAWTDIARRTEELEVEEQRLERDKKAFAKRCKIANAAASACGGMQPPAVPSDEQAEQEEIYRLRMQKLKDKKKSLQEEKEKLEREKYSMIRELKRVQDQNRSKYNSFPLLNKRYLLLHLHGKGGFSEVYRAFDLIEMQEVACKIHELNVQWSEEKKSNYMKHATREYEIQKKLCHQRIVRLMDVFEVSSDGFCTVLEFCDGGDLEQILKAQKTISEREARSIIMQVFAGLRYLNEQKLKVIHYDLKPANILFHNGEVKISDFGLSKIMDDSKDGMMELTSQGAGTYWYLPPECFEIGHAPPKISSKVDVWSTGVIFFQMLFGVKPFGHGMSQEKMLIEQTITKSTMVHFPEGKDVPKVSDRAKDFVRRCLAYQQTDRPDVLSVFQDPYLRHTGRQASSATS